MLNMIVWFGYDSTQNSAWQLDTNERMSVVMSEYD